MNSSRRKFLRKAALGAAGLGLASTLPARVIASSKRLPASNGDLFFKIAVSQFSFASQFWTKKLDPLALVSDAPILASDILRMGGPAQSGGKNLQ